MIPDTFMSISVHINPCMLDCSTSNMIQFNLTLHYNTSFGIVLDSKKCWTRVGLAMCNGSYWGWKSSIAPFLDERV